MQPSQPTQADLPTCCSWALKSLHIWVYWTIHWYCTAPVIDLYQTVGTRFGNQSSPILSGASMTPPFQSNSPRNPCRRGMLRENTPDVRHHHGTHALIKKDEKGVATWGIWNHVPIRRHMQINLWFYMFGLDVLVVGSQVFWNNPKLVKWGKCLMNSGEI